MALITGTSGGNNLRGTTGRDTINGLAGNDTIDPGRGADRVDGGVGADVIHWNQDAASRGVVDTYVGGSTGESYDSNPYFDRSGGDRLVLGGQNGFRVTFSSTEDGHALDAFGNRVNFTQFERLTTGSGNDVIDASKASVEAARGSGNAANYVPVHGIDVVAGAGHDRIIGSKAADVIDGGAGNDTINAGAGDDFIQSSTGNDLIHAGAGNDNIRWGQGNFQEVIGNDTIDGGAGHDLINVWVKDGYNENGPGVKVVMTSATSGTSTTMIGGARSNLNFKNIEQVWTHEGRDTIDGANASVSNNKGFHANGRWGDDSLIGSRGNDTLEGGEGADTLDGRGGNDFISMVEDYYRPLGSSVTPDSQRDTLVMRDAGGFDTIRGFQVGDLKNANGSIARHGDVLNLNNLHDKQGNVVDVNDVRVSETNGQAVLTFPNGEKIMLEGVRAASLTRAKLLQMGFKAPNSQEVADAVQETATTATAKAAVTSTPAVADTDTVPAVEAGKAADAASGSSREPVLLDKVTADLRETPEPHVVDAKAESFHTAAKVFKAKAAAAADSHLGRVSGLQAGVKHVQDLDSKGGHDHDGKGGHGHYGGKDCPPVPCFCAGTLIDTPRGPVAVEALQPGDLVLTRDNGARALRWIGRRVLDAAELASQPKLRPIRIRAGALSAGIPHSDLMVSPQHRVLVRSSIAQRMFGAAEVLVAARQLLALDGIEQVDADSVEYVHILFDGHEVVTSNGALTESLYTGPEAMQAVGDAARAEILTIFPELRDTPAAAARPLVTGAQARQLAQRHMRNAKALVSA